MSYDKNLGGRIASEVLRYNHDSFGCPYSRIMGKSSFLLDMR